MDDAPSNFSRLHTYLTSPGTHAPTLRPSHPGTIDAHPWTIHYFPDGSSVPSVTTIEHIAHLPFDPTPSARFQRAHELGHIAHTPPISPAELAANWDLPPITIQWAEDFRINYLQRHHVTSYATDAATYLRSNDPLQHIAAAIRYNTTNALFNATVHLINLLTLSPDPAHRRLTTTYTNRLRRALRDTPGFPTHVLNPLLASIRTTAHSIYTSLTLAMHTRRTPYPHHFRPFPNDINLITRPIAEHLAELLENSTKRHTPQPSATTPKPDPFPTPRSTPGHRHPIPARSCPPWLPTLLINPPLTEPTTTTHLAPTPIRRRSGWGTRIAYAYRLRTDGRSFTTRRYRYRSTGSYLLDASGSMGWGLHDLLDHIAATPHATLAIYSTTSTHHLKSLPPEWPITHLPTSPRPEDIPDLTHERGFLAIIAANGRRASTDSITRIVEDFRTGGNGCDGPALQWLATCPAPRIWYSDEGVSGLGDCCHNDLRLEARDTCHTHHITRVPPTGSLSTEE